MSDDEKEMIKNLDLLMNMDVLESEEDWDVLDGMEEASVESQDFEDGEES
tara:strand:- start:62137 stop:62286 length:150 start_codon:yes stop_codon:yes gene_type:complete